MHHFYCRNIFVSNDNAKFPRLVFLIIHTFEYQQKGRSRGFVLRILAAHTFSVTMPCHAILPRRGKNVDKYSVYVTFHDR